MHCTYRVHDTRLLLEATPDELFTFLGPHLVECVCAVRSRDGVVVDTPIRARLNPDALVPVVVVACRSERGEPEFYPTGYQTELSGGSPIVFLESAQSLPLRPVGVGRALHLEVPEPPAPVTSACVGGTGLAFTAKKYGFVDDDMGRPEIASRL